MTNKEKQIEEMARIMTKFDGKMCERLPNNCLLTRYTHAQINCNFCKTAEDIYNAGYRKASSVAREIFEEIDRMCIDTFGNFNHRVFAELKNKYIGKDTNVTTNTEDGK